MRLPLSDRIDIYCDGVKSAKDVVRVVTELGVKGVTTNPSLARAAGVTDYRAWCDEIAGACADHGVPVSLEVLADDHNGILREAKILQQYCGGEDVDTWPWIKVPIVDSRGGDNTQAIRQVSSYGVRVNVTALFTPDQVHRALDALDNDVDAILSVFAGRIADTGADPRSTIVYAKDQCANPNLVHREASRRAARRILWASWREPLNIMQAVVAGADIITAPEASLRKAAESWGRDLTEYASATSRQFLEDAQAAGYTL